MLPTPRLPKSLGESLPIEIRDLRVEVPFNVASIYHFRYTREGQEPVEMDVRSNPRFIPCNWSPAAPDFDQYAGTYEANVENDANPRWNQADAGQRLLGVRGLCKRISGPGLRRAARKRNVHPRRLLI